MGTVDYQNPDKARQQTFADWKHRLFGVSRKEVWAALAHEISARHEQGGWLRSDRVVASVPPWTVTLDLYTEGAAEISTTHTRLRAPFVNPGGFRFKLYRKSIFSDLGKLLGMQDIGVGDPPFDEDFIIQGNDEARVRELLRDPHLRELIAVQPRISFSIKDDEGWFGATFPDGVDELHFLAWGVVKDVERLKQMFDLLAVTLNRLCEIRAARPEWAGVDL